MDRKFKERKNRPVIVNGNSVFQVRGVTKIDGKYHVQGGWIKCPFGGSTCSTNCAAFESEQPEGGMPTFSCVAKRRLVLGRFILRVKYQSPRASSLSIEATPRNSILAKFCDPPVDPHSATPEDNNRDTGKGGTP